MVHELHGRTVDGSWHIVTSSLARIGANNPYAVTLCGIKRLDFTQLIWEPKITTQVWCTRCVAPAKPATTCDDCLRPYVPTSETWNPDSDCPRSFQHDKYSQVKCLRLALTRSQADLKRSMETVICREAEWKSNQDQLKTMEVNYKELSKSLDRRISSNQDVLLQCVRERDAARAEVKRLLVARGHLVADNIALEAKLSAIQAKIAEWHKIFSK